jgi:hypothetical protein
LSLLLSLLLQSCLDSWAVARVAAHNSAALAIIKFLYVMFASAALDEGGPPRLSGYRQYFPEGKGHHLSVERPATLV